MTVMLLVLSLFLNILAFVAIITLYLRQSRLIESEKKQAKATEEMEDIISTYLTQMKEENDEFLQKLSDLSNSNHVRTTSLEKNTAVKPDTRTSKNERKTEPKAKSSTKPKTDQKTEAGTKAEKVQKTAQGAKSEIKPATEPKPDPKSESKTELEDPAAFQTRIGKVAAYQAAKVYQQSKEAIDTKKTVNHEQKEPFIQAESDKADLPIAKGQQEMPKSQQPTLLSQVLVLKNLGLSNEEIAKKLSKGKTEIQLLLKFHEKQQE
ncbi:hypothetical protein [Cytobacillus gottheilii]|uniref:hypothetical protein n=1 Tax=Cytobacillus gottheilii TaxID=859144 RepID=UPI0009BB7EBE|nr:hypothetical protein [Cytobacillus gottheilii]